MSAANFNPDDPQQPDGKAAPESGADDGLDLSQTAAHPAVPEPGSTGPLRLPTAQPHDAADESPTVISKREDPPSWSHYQPSDLAQRLVGVDLDHYHLEEFIGGGGMGAVFKANDTLLGRTVAVKILSRVGADDELLRRFVNEAKSAAKLDHENIARVFYVGQALGWNYIVFEFIDGRNLRQIVAEEGPLPIDLAVRYICQLTRALDHASQRQVIHRDIKPSNVIVTREHRAKLVDMGLARIHQLDRETEDLTASGMTLGTFDYISPEQARDPRAADVRSDIYSLGCTFFYIVTGQPPFPDGTPLQKLLSHQEALRPHPQEFRPDLPDSLTRIIERQLAADPKQRQQSPSELLAELLLAAEALDIDVEAKESLVIEPVPVTAHWLGKLVPVAIPAIGLLAIFLLIETLSSNSLDDPQLPAPTYRDTVLLQPPTPPDNGETSENNTGNNQANDTPNPNPATGNGSSPPETRDDNTTATPRDNTSTVPANTNNGPDPDIESSPTSPANAASTNTLIVGNGGTLGLGMQRVPTLEAAIEQANSDDAIRQIELRFNGPQPTAPFEVRSRELKLVAGNGYKPSLQFTASDEQLDSPNIVNLQCEKWLLRGIDLELQVSEGAFRQLSWFQIEQDYEQWSENRATVPVQDFEFSDCRFTVRPVRRSDSEALPTVSVVQVRRPSQFILEIQNVDVFKFPNVILRRTMVRGDCQLLRCTPATPFNLQWEQSAFVSPKSAIQLGGLDDSDPRDLAQKQVFRSVIDARFVTMIAPGLVDVRVSSTDPEPLPFDLRTMRCWFTLGESNPLVRHQLFEIPADLSRIAFIDSEENLYPREVVLWELLTPSSAPTTLSEAELDGDESWYRQSLNESPLTSSQVWRDILQGTAPSQDVTLADLTSALASLGRASSRAVGVDPEELPWLADPISVMPSGME